MSLSSDLFRLQKIDSQRDQCSSRIREIEQTLAADTTLRQAQELLKKADLVLMAAQKNLKITEEFVQKQNTKIELNQHSLYGGKVRNPKELQDLQNEAAALKRQLTHLEDEQLDSMLALEKAESSQAQAKEALQNTERKVIEKQSTLVGERDRLIRDLERLDSERQAAARSLPPQSLAVYESLRQQKKGLAVVEVFDQSCSACGQTLTPSEWQVARSPHQLAFCPSCARILYAG